MNFYDCFTYNNEELVLDIRLNYLNKFVKKFIDAKEIITRVAKKFKTEVKSKKFPTKKNSY